MTKSKLSYLLVIRVFLSLFALTIYGCQNVAKPLQGNALEEHALNASIEAAFGPDGRLWRLIPTENAVFLQSSTDNGKNYSQAVRVNSKDQIINVWPENPPIVEIGRSGRIHILYYVNEEQKATSLFTYSDDDGKTFSKPVHISAQAANARNYMDKMLIDDEGKIYLFWHDTRHEQHKENPVPGSLTLYYAATENPTSGYFNNLAVSENICSCCRTAAALTTNNYPILLARMVFPDGSRDHALISLGENGNWSTPQRIAYDNWKIDACPEHGPAMAIDKQNRIHMTWFTQGDSHQGLYYAHSDDGGKTISEPSSLGNKAYLPGHADVQTLNDKVLIAWQEFDGSQTHVWSLLSTDHGKHWTAPREIVKASNKTSFPKLISNNKQIYLSWTGNGKHHMIDLTQ